MIDTHKIIWVDIAKGIAIILVCLGHRNIPTVMNKWIYSFHMPLFFFLSGYTTNFNKYNSWKVFINRKFKKLIIPYLSLGVIWITIKAIFNLFYLKESINILQYIQFLFYGDNIGSSWFVTTLFITEVISYGIYHLSTRRYISATVILVCIGFGVDSILKNQLIWNFNTALIGVLFFQTAQIIKQNQLLHDTLSPIQLTLLFFVCIIVSAISINTNSLVDMHRRCYGNVILFMVGAFSGIIIMVLFSMLLEKVIIVRRILCFFGTNTFPIIEFHFFPGYMITETLLYKLFNLVYTHNNLSGNLEGFIHVWLVLILIIPLILFLNRFAPWMVGKTNN